MGTAARPPWTSRYKDNWDDAYERVMSWWEGAGLDRPLVMNPVPRPEAHPFVPPAEWATSGEDDLDVGYALAFTRHRLENRLYLAEAAPVANTMYASGLGMLASMADARISYSPEAFTAWIERVEDVYSRPLPEFNSASRPYAFAIRMIHRHAGEFGYDAILGANTLMDPLTTLSMMRGVEELCLDLIERPRMVKAWVRQLGDIYLRILEGYREARARHGRREDANWTSMWAPGDFDAVLCDFACMLSPEMFNEFMMPELEREVEFFDYTLFHLDGTQQIQHLDAICSLPGIRAIQWVENQGRSPTERLELFRRIRRHKKSVLLSCPNGEEAVELTKQLGKDGLAIYIGGWMPGQIKSEGEMEALLRSLRAA